MEILSQLNKACAYIEEHITDELATDDVASVTIYSPFHFGRMFYYITGMPLSEYIRKRKMSLAAERLKLGEKVIDVAAMFGYDSADSFARAFKGQHGVNPSTARNSDIVVAIFPPLAFQIKIKGAEAMNWRIEKREAFAVFGLERVYRMDEQAKVPGFWDDIEKNGEGMKLLDDAGGREASGALPLMGICGYRQTGQGTFPYMIGARTAPGCKTDGYTLAEVPESTWAVFRSKPIAVYGTEIPKLFERAFSEWLPSSKYARTEAPDLEYYLEGDDGKYYEEVWIP
ncbi:MAG: AraC family transcriptional regulator, partial [Clostridiales bacterium]|nr:AraC family transcriptional regulator [Clostridiales bacterium]